MTSASGDIFTKRDVEAGAGAMEVTVMFAVVVGDRCSVRGCGDDA
jgi:hypothetical protein